MKNIVNFIGEGLRINKNTNFDKPKFNPQDDVERMTFFAKETIFKDIELREEDFKLYKDSDLLVAKNFNTDVKFAIEFYNKRNRYLNSIMHTTSAVGLKEVWLNLNSKLEDKYNCDKVSVAIFINDNNEIEKILLSKAIKDILINI